MLDTMLDCHCYRQEREQKPAFSPSSTTPCPDVCHEAREDFGDEAIFTRAVRVLSETCLYKWYSWRLIKNHLLFSSTNSPNVELISLPFSKRQVPMQAAKFYETKRRVCQ